MPDVSRKETHKACLSTHYEKRRRHLALIRACTKILPNNQLCFIWNVNQCDPSWMHFACLTSSSLDVMTAVISNGNKYGCFAFGVTDTILTCFHEVDGGWLPKILRLASIIVLHTG